MTEGDVEPERTLTSKTIFDGKLVRLRVDTVSLPNGRESIREVVKSRPAAVIIPIDGEDNIILVRQYRYAAGAALLEAPAGVVEESETPEQCGRRELQEETGYLPRSLRPLGSFWSSPGFCTEHIYAYLATDLVSSPLDPDPDEIVSIERVPLSAVWDLVRQGEIRDAKTLAALLMFDKAVGGAPSR